MAEIAQDHNCNKKQVMIMQMHGAARKPLLPKPDHHQNQAEEVKLAALAISSNVRLRAADMPSAMQERALRHARALLDSSDRRRPNPTLLARSLKKEFDSVYGPAWHCVAGKSFGSFVTHSPGGFVYFSVDSLSFLLFKTEVHVVAQPRS
ncbi:Dynein light chain, cytoplasmic [Sesamum alatum]|uniref:Dynein light chain n=1 Tax=Sesamum alatum TaxID=300844 RepID=A0AAE2CYE3_9LAMI|nr:Dynein light chain, cytoplasmic [Sesamum alatum]